MICIVILLADMNGSYLDGDGDPRRFVNASHYFAAVALSKDLAIHDVVSNNSLEPFPCHSVGVALRVNFNRSPIQDYSSARPKHRLKVKSPLISFSFKILGV